MNTKCEAERFSQDHLTCCPIIDFFLELYGPEMSRCKYQNVCIKQSLMNFVFLTVIVTNDGKDLLNLINDSLRAAKWLIAEAIGIIIAVIIATVTAIVNFQPTVKHVYAIIVSFGQYT